MLRIACSVSGRVPSGHRQSVVDVTFLDRLMILDRLEDSRPLLGLFTRNT